MVDQYLTVGCIHRQRERRRQRNERARETALNIDGALRYRSIRQPSSHNYASASSRMIHHMDMHDYILLALEPKNIWKDNFKKKAEQR